jgi:hypothetical protein
MSPLWQSTGNAFEQEKIETRRAGCDWLMEEKPAETSAALKDFLVNDPGQIFAITRRKCS